MEMIKKAVILAGGRGTRFLPYTKSAAKEMIAVVDKPVLQYIVEECVDAGITDILIVGRKDKPGILEHFKKDAELEDFLERAGKLDLKKQISDVSSKAKVTVIEQPSAEGSGAAVLLAEEYVRGEPFAVLNGDDLYFSLSGRSAIGQVADAFEKNGKTTVGVMQVEKSEISKYCSLKTNAEFGKPDEVIDVIEKPDAAAAPSDVAALGRYVCDANFFDYLKRTSRSAVGELNITDAFGLQARSEGIFACPLNVVRYDTGDKLGYMKANVEFALRHETIGKEFAAYLKELTKSL